MEKMLGSFAPNEKSVKGKKTGMKMTEKMKQSLMEGMRQEGAKLSDEELDEVAERRGFTLEEDSTVMFAFRL